MIKSKLRLAKGSFAPYAAALLSLAALIFSFIDVEVSMQKYRFSGVWPMQNMDQMYQIAWYCQVGAFFLLTVLLIAAVKKKLWVLIFPALLYAGNTILLALKNNQVYYYLLIGALVSLYFLLLTVLNLLHSKNPAVICDVLLFAGVVVLCALKQQPFVENDATMGTYLNLSLLVQTLGYYGSLLIVMLALEKKYIAAVGLSEEHVRSEQEPQPEEEKAAKKPSAMKKKEPAVENTSKMKQAEEKPKTAKHVMPETVTEDVLEEAMEDAGATVYTVPMSGSALQKSLKEEIVCDRDQKLVYRKKVNVFAVIGMVISVLALIAGVIMTFELLPIDKLKNDSLGMMMITLGLCMLCIFGTRLVTKEYYTKTIVTERKVLREENNWEEFIANRLEEDEKSMKTLTENYMKMSELYAHLLETTAELSTGLKRLSTENAQLLADMHREEEEPEAKQEAKSTAAEFAPMFEMPEDMTGLQMEESVLEEPIAEEAFAEEPIEEEPIKEEPVAETPYTEEPIEEEPIEEEPIAEEPIEEEPIKEEPVAETPYTEEPIAEEPIEEEPIAEDPIEEEPIKEEPVAETPYTEEPIAEEPIAEEPIAEEPIAEEPAAEAQTESVPAEEEDGEDFWMGKFADEALYAMFRKETEEALEEETQKETEEAPEMEVAEAEAPMAEAPMAEAPEMELPIAEAPEAELPGNETEAPTMLEEEADKEERRRRLHEQLEQIRKRNAERKAYFEDNE